MDNNARSDRPERIVYAAPTYTVNVPEKSVAQPAVGDPAGTVVRYAPIEQQKSPQRVALDKAGERTPMVLLTVLAFIFGAVFSEMILRGGFGLGVTAVTVLFLAMFVPFIIKRGKGIPVGGILFTIVPLVIIAVSFAFNASFEGRFLMVLAVLLLGIVGTTAMSGCTANRPLSAGGLVDSVRAYTLTVLESIGGAFSAMRRSGKSKNGEKQAGAGKKVLLGLLISIPVVLLLAATFSLADAVFAQLVQRIIDAIENLDINVGGLILDILVGAVMCVYIIPLVLSLRAGYSEEKRDYTPNRWLDPVIGSTVVIASTIVYLIFVAVQFNYFFAVRAGYFLDPKLSDAPYLPDGMTWAEYARSGFFELSAIIIATFAVVALIIAFCKRRGNGRIPTVMRVALTVLSLCNLVLVASAVMRMRLYTLWCGLTAKRVGVLLTITVIALSIIAAVIKIWWDKFNLVGCVSVLAIIAITAFSCMNVDAMCARTNVARHIEDGTSIDIEYLGKLSYAAAPAVERLMNESPDPDVRAAAKGIIAKNYYYGDGESWNNSPIYKAHWGAWTYDHERAYRIFKKYEPERRCADDYGLYASWQSEKRYHEQNYNSEYEYPTFGEYRKEHAWYHYYGYPDW